MKLTNKFKLKLEKYATKLSGEHIKIKYDIIFNNYIGWTPWRGPYHYSTIFLNKEWVLKQKTLAPIYGAIAHEIGHIILLRPGFVGRDEPDMEPLNDLLTLFLGFGIFTANSAFRFAQYTTNDSQGWSSQRLGYLEEPVLGYALARFAYERHEEKPAWASFVKSNISPYMKRSLAWLLHHQQGRLLS